MNRLERRIVICFMMWVMTALITTRVEALDVGDITPALPPPIVLWQDAQDVAQLSGLGEIQSLVQTGQDDEGFAQRLGFASADEVRGVAQVPPRINTPFGIIRVDLNRLQNFK